MSRKNAFAALLMAAALAPPMRTEKARKPFTKPQTRRASGVERYFFYANGLYYTENNPSRHSYGPVVFDCVARDVANAVRKFQNFQRDKAR